MTEYVSSLILLAPHSVARDKYGYYYWKASLLNAFVMLGITITAVVTIVTSLCQSVK